MELNHIQYVIKVWLLLKTEELDKRMWILRPNIRICAKPCAGTFHERDIDLSILV